ncbi:hypothetical protein GGI42DRAFT_31348 [Trichoderma sp. SZMC 28013]
MLASTWALYQLSSVDVSPAHFPRRHVRSRYLRAPGHERGYTGCTSHLSFWLALTLSDSGPESCRKASTLFSSSLHHGHRIVAEFSHLHPASYSYGQLVAVFVPVKVPVKVPGCNATNGGLRALLTIRFEAKNIACLVPREATGLEAQSPMLPWTTKMRIPVEIDSHGCVAMLL